MRLACIALCTLIAAGKFGGDAGFVACALVALTHKEKKS